MARFTTFDGDPHAAAIESITDLLSEMTLTPAEADAIIEIVRGRTRSDLMPRLSTSYRSSFYRNGGYYLTRVTSEVQVPVAQYPSTTTTVTQHSSPTTTRSPNSYRAEVNTSVETRTTWPNDSGPSTESQEDKGSIPTFEIDSDEDDGAPTVEINGHFVCAYLGTYYFTPVNEATGPFYYVTVGKQIGVFSTWEVVEPLVSVTGAVYYRCPSIIDGYNSFLDAVTAHETRVIV